MLNEVIAEAIDGAAGLQGRVERLQGAACVAGLFAVNQARPNKAAKSGVRSVRFIAPVILLRVPSPGGRILAFRRPVESDTMESGGMAERFKAAVLKTVDGVTRPGVRIPLPPPLPV